MKYVVSIAGRDIEVDVDGDRVMVDGRTRTASLTRVPGTPLRQLLLDGRQMAFTLRDEGTGAWEIGFAGERWRAEALDERTRHIRSLVGAADQTRGPGPLRAPMPGLVVRVHAEPGQTVAAGTGMVVLEAMKMENELRAATPAVVKAVHARPGETVEKGQLLVEFA